MKKPLYAQVLNDLRRQIHAGELRDRIPTETTLANSFQVSLSTVQKALNVLKDENIIVRIQGKGSFVRAEARGVLQGSDDANDEEQFKEQPKEQVEEQAKEQLEQLKKQLKEQIEKELIEQFERRLEEPMKEQATVETTETASRLRDKPPVVGVILPNAEDGFSRRLLSGVLEGLSANGAHALVDFSGRKRERESEIVVSFLQNGINGLIVFPVDGEIYNKDLVQLSFERFPVVFVDRWLPGIDISRVVSQHANGVKEAVNALYAAGHRNMALASVGEFSTSTESIVERTKGFLGGLKANGIIPTEDLLWIPEVKSDSTFQDALGYLTKKFRQHPEVTALVGISSFDVRVALEAARLTGRKVPHDLSITGFDIGAECSDGGGLFEGRVEDFPIAWLDQSEVVIGKEAAGVMNRLIAGSGKTEVIEVPVTFRWGRTCGPAPAVQEHIQMTAASDEMKK